MTDDEKSYLRRIERKLDHDLKYKESMRNLDPIFRKQNRALVDVSALKRYLHFVMIAVYKYYIKVTIEFISLLISKLFYLKRKGTKRIGKREHSAERHVT